MNTFLLAFMDGEAQPHGYAKLRNGTTDPSVTGPDPVELQRLYVNPSTIRHGVGAALMRASLDAAMKAWAAGDYNAAARLLKPRADEGDPEAQFNLGLYYFQGLGGDRNYAEASKLFRGAAEQGHIMAANNLGAMNMDGRGIPRNLPEAWFWFAVVAHRGDQAGGVLRDLVASQMTRPQVEQARDRFETWRDKNDAPWWKKAYRYVTGSQATR
jgi:TPR repeat protein